MEKDDCDGTWLLRATHRVALDEETINEVVGLLEDLAGETFGEYDGHEIELP